MHDYIQLHIVYKLIAYGFPCAFAAFSIGRQTVNQFRITPPVIIDMLRRQNKFDFALHDVSGIIGFVYRRSAEVKEHRGINTVAVQVERKRTAVQRRGKRYHTAQGFGGISLPRVVVIYT